jgi:hypothetical protein
MQKDRYQKCYSFFGVPWREEGELSPSPHVRDRFPARLALGFNVICDEEDLVTPENELRLLTFDPFDYAAWKVLTMYHHGPIRFVMTTRRRLIDVIKSTYGVGAETFEELMEGREEEAFSSSVEEVNVVDEEDSSRSELSARFCLVSIVPFTSFMFDFIIIFLFLLFCLY